MESALLEMCECGFQGEIIRVGSQSKKGKVERKKKKKLSCEQPIMLWLAMRLKMMSADRSSFGEKTSKE